MTSKEFYKTYRADDNISPIAETMMALIKTDGCVHAFEFGMGTGKHLLALNEMGICTFGFDVSLINCIVSQANNMGIAYADEGWLRHLCNFDCTFTVSVLDHIQYASDVIIELQRITNKVVYLIETNDVIGEYYYPHDYKKHGFESIAQWTSDGDGATYDLWRWYKNV